MHANEARPHPLPPFRAHASGTRPAPLDTTKYFWDELNALGWADRQATVDTVFIERTTDRYPYCVDGQIYRRVAPGVWLRHLSDTEQQTAEMR